MPSITLFQSSHPSPWKTVLQTAETSILILKGKRKDNKVEISYYDRKEEREYNVFFRIVRKLNTIFKKI